MNDASESPEESSEQAPAAPAQFPGELLAQAREAKGLSRIELSALLGLTQAAIRDIELNRFDTFPSGIYVRGYMRNYSKMVEIDAEVVMDAYDQYSKTHPVPQESPFGASSANVESTAQKQRKALIVGAALALVVVIIAVAVSS